MPASETWTELLWKDLANRTVSENNELGRNLHEVYDNEKTTTMTAMMTATSVLFWRQNDVVPVTAGRSAGRWSGDSRLPDRQMDGRPD